MVSFTSLVLVSLMAATQLVHSAAVPANGAPLTVSSLPKCEEHPELSSHSIPASNFKKQSNVTPTLLVGKQGSMTPTYITIEKSEKTGQLITTIDTHETVSFQDMVAVVWKLSLTEDKIFTRYFKLTPGQKCRVEKSAGYADLYGAGFVYPGTH